MKNNPAKLWISAFALGLFFDFLVWEKEPGINFALFASACVAVAFTLLLGDGLRPRLTTLSLIPFFGFFAAVSFIRAEPLTIFLAVVFTLLCMAVLSMTYLGGRWYLYTIADYIGKAFQLLASLVARPVGFMIENQKSQKESGSDTSKRNIWPVLRGIAIALPIIAIFASLLSAADAVFEQKLGNLLDWLSFENLPELIFRFVYISVIAYALSGVFLHASSESKDEKLSGEDKPFVPAFLGFTESSIVLGSVVALFAAFVVIQFQYFFGGVSNINIEGYTYSQYARRGFGELVTVAFFALVMLLSLNAVTKRETETQRKIYSGMGVALVALLLVMLVSAFKRLGLYEEIYGFSRLRTYTHVFLIWIGLLLVAVIALEVFRKERMFAFTLLVASFGFAISLPILNVDEFIVRQNVLREMQNHTDEDYVPLDAQYFVELSEDAVPEIVRHYKNESLPESVREKLGASLACIVYQDGRGERDRETPWQSYHFARAQAESALETVKDDLKAYSVLEDNWYGIVTTPSGEDFYCSAYYMD